MPAGAALAVDRELLRRRADAARSRRSRAIERRARGGRPRLPAGVRDRRHRTAHLAGAVRGARASCSAATHLYFYDAIAPIVTADSIDTAIAFAGLALRQGRRRLPQLSARPRRVLRRSSTRVLGGREGADARLRALRLLRGLHADRGDGAPRAATRSPSGRCGRSGLIDPRTGKRPFAVVQLRQDDAEATLYNMVGFQTKMTYPEQRRVFRMIPGLERAEFVRLGSLHRNTFINSPSLLLPTLQLRGPKRPLLAGQLIGVEGYVESAATGFLAGLNAARLPRGRPLRRAAADHGARLAARLRHRPRPRGLPADERQLRPLPAAGGLAARPREAGRARRRAAADLGRGSARRRSIPARPRPRSYATPRDGSRRCLARRAAEHRGDPARPSATPAVGSPPRRRGRARALVVARRGSRGRGNQLRGAARRWLGPEAELGRGAAAGVRREPGPGRES